MIETLITILLAPYLIYKLEKFDSRQQEIIADIAMIKRHIPKRLDDVI